MDDATRYREFAAMCTRAASHVSRDDHKTALLDLVREWNELADGAEAASRLAGHRP